MDFKGPFIFITNVRNSRGIQTKNPRVLKHRTWNAQKSPNTDRLIPQMPRKRQKGILGTLRYPTK